MTRYFVAVHALLVGVGIAVAQGVAAHHSYSMFDGTRTLTVQGTVAKLEWTNPHVFIWLYVPSASAASGFELFAFENGSPNVLSRGGWSPTTFAAGEELTLEYWPLLDGRSGGHFRQATRKDGSVMRGAGGPRGLDGTLPPEAAQ
jgi:hypothetical protein